ncbi:Membrane protein [Streptomyces hygroscopicus subsp. limoneus]|nr:Membrane protein [Streptomyces hygroscopicus subsp. limoneus]
MTEAGQRRGRNETEEERADRMWGELIQEVRVAQTGVQILFGFLLTVVFQPKYTQLSAANQVIYIVTVVLGACATGALIGPVSLHRLVSGRRVKPQAVRLASRMTFVGLVMLLATMTSSLLLILRVATHDGYVPYLVAAVVAWYLLCWYGLPLWARRRHTSRTDR